MSARRAALVVPVGAFLASLALFVALLAARGHELAPRRVGWLVAASALLGLTARFGVWTWRRLWREPGDDGWSRMVYDQGVRRFGVPTALGVPVVQAFLGARNDLGFGTTEAIAMFLQMLWVGLIVWLPLGLWTGYWWGRGMATASGLRRPDDTK